MTYCPEKHHRHSIRLPGYDYAQMGAYFVTVCAWNRECLFGAIEIGEMRLYEAGHIVSEEWIKTAEIRKEIELDDWVVMPNHFHGILVICNDVGLAIDRQTDAGSAHGRGTARRAPTLERFGQPVSGSIPTVIRSFKSAVAKRVNEMRRTPGKEVWQRNYFEHIIRNDDELNRIRQYIADNPAQWGRDRENPNGGTQND